MHRLMLVFAGMLALSGCAEDPDRANKEVRQRHFAVKCEEAGFNAKQCAFFHSGADAP